MNLINVSLRKTQTPLFRFVVDLFTTCCVQIHNKWKQSSLDLKPLMHFTIKLPGQPNGYTYSFTLTGELILND